MKTLFLTVFLVSLTTLIFTTCTLVTAQICKSRFKINNEYNYADITWNFTNNKVETTASDGITYKGLLKPITIEGEAKYVAQYLGIPFAMPPIGDLRFKPPEFIKLKCTTGFEIDATAFKNVCIQRSNTKPTTMASEDCLYLNIWYPLQTNRCPVKDASNDKFVMVWIHGGKFIEGGTSEPQYDGTILAAKEDVVVVSIQYRLGPFGFLRYGDIKGNMGLLDQLLALKWIRKNIGDFGGSDSEITLFGQDAGAASIGFHILSPQSQPLFKNAIMQSGSPMSEWFFNSPLKAEQMSQKFLNSIGCKASISCLTNVDAQDMLDGYYPQGSPGGLYLFKPTIDGDFIKAAPQCGKTESKNILIGTTNNEGSVYINRNFPNDFPNDLSTTTSYSSFYSLMKEHIAPGKNPFLDKLKESYKAYDISKQEWNHTRAAIFDQIFGDRFVRCPMQEFLDSFNPGLRNISYSYKFNFRSKLSALPDWLGVPHDSEIQYVFGLPFGGDTSPYNDEDRKISSEIMNIWATFSKIGKPEDGIQPCGYNRTTFVIGKSQIIEQDTGDYKCPLWNSLKALPCRSSSMTYSSISMIIIFVMLTFVLNFEN